MKRQTGVETHPLVEDEWDQALSLIPVDLETTARRDKALRRRREIRCASDLLRLVLAYSLCDWSLRLVGAWGVLIGIGQLSDVAVLKRLRQCLTWLGKLIVAWMIHRQITLSQQPVRLRLIDATTISQPGSKGIDWRVHLTLNLGQLCLDGVEVTDVKGGETLIRHPSKRGDIMLVDRGYAHRRGIGSALAEGGWVVGRINWQNLPLQDQTKEPFDLIAWLRRLPLTEASETQVWVDTPHGFFKMRLIARRLSKKATKASRRRIRKEARKKGRTPNWRSIVAAGFVILVTSLPKEEWSTEEVLELYRIRWQVELMFKRLKGVLDLDQLRSKDSTLAQVYLLGKLLAALMSDELTGQVSLSHPDWFESMDRPLSPWRMLVVLTDWMCDAVRGVITLGRIMAALGSLGRYLRDTPRKRPQQCAQARALLLALNSG